MSGKLINLYEALRVRAVFHADKVPAHGRVQWKGTSVCMDIHCACGAHSHIDDDFTYYVRCPACGAVYSVNPNVELQRLTSEELEHVERGSPGCIKGEDPDAWASE